MRLVSMVRTLRREMRLTFLDTFRDIIETSRILSVGYNDFHHFFCSARGARGYLVPKMCKCASISQKKRKFPKNSPDFEHLGLEYAFFTLFSVAFLVSNLARPSNHEERSDDCHSIAPFFNNFCQSNSFARLAVASFTSFWPT